MRGWVVLAINHRWWGHKLLVAALDAFLAGVGAPVLDGSCACLRSRLS
jgi:hypothetical protein